MRSIIAIRRAVLWLLVIVSSMSLGTLLHPFERQTAEYYRAVYQSQTQDWVNAMYQEKWREAFHKEMCGVQK